MITLTTVGYGDLYPVTAGGRAFAGVVVVIGIGIGIIAVPSGLLAAALTSGAKERLRAAARDDL